MVTAFPFHPSGVGMQVRLTNPDIPLAMMFDLGMYMFPKLGQLESSLGFLC